MADSRDSSARKLTVKGVVSVALLIVALIFVFSNLAPGRVHFLTYSVVMPTWVWFLLVLVVGVVIGSLFPWFRLRRRR